MYLLLKPFNKFLTTTDPQRPYYFLQNLLPESWGTWRQHPVEYVTDYYWLVVCKNHRFHHKGNIGYEHKILLGEADAFGGPPTLPEKVEIRCDSCGEAYSYKRKEVMRDEVQVPESFVPHPLFK